MRLLANSDNSRLLFYPIHPAPARSSGSCGRSPDQATYSSFSFADGQARRRCGTPAAAEQEGTPRKEDLPRAGIIPNYIRHDA
jgi:hypothetical protein